MIYILSSERDLVPAEGVRQKAGLLAVGNPAFEQAGDTLSASVLRDANISCDAPMNNFARRFTESRYRPTTRIVKLPGTIVGLGRGVSAVGAGRGPRTAAGR